MAYGFWRRARVCHSMRSQRKSVRWTSPTKSPRTSDKSSTACRYPPHYRRSRSADSSGSIPSPRFVNSRKIGKIVWPITSSMLMTAHLQSICRSSWRGRGQWTDPLAGKVTLRSYANDWLAGRSDLRDTTRAKYRYLLDRHILPRLGTTKLSTLAPSQLRSWYHELHSVRAATGDD